MHLWSLLVHVQLLTTKLDPRTDHALQQCDQTTDLLSRLRSNSEQRADCRSWKLPSVSSTLTWLSESVCQNGTAPIEGWRQNPTSKGFPDHQITDVKKHQASYARKQMHQPYPNTLARAQARQGKYQQPHTNTTEAQKQVLKAPEADTFRCCQSFIYF